MNFLPLALLLGGVALGVVGFLGFTERLKRNRFAGVRTPATMRSDEAFRVGNKVAGLPTLTGGVIALAGAVVAWLMPTDTGLLTVVLVATAGMLVPTIAGGILGARTAGAVPDPQAQAPAGCKGCQCGGCGIPGRAN